MPIGDKIYGTTGKVDVPAVGLLIGEMSSWELKRRKDPPPDKGPFVLRASFSHVIPWMFRDPAIEHRIVVEIGRGQQYRLETDDDARTVLDGPSLLIEGVTLCRVEQSRPSEATS
jgi:hypothetical protein